MRSKQAFIWDQRITILKSQIQVKTQSPACTMKARDF